MWLTEKEENYGLLSNMKGCPPFAFGVGSWATMKDIVLNLQVVKTQIDNTVIGLEPMEIPKMGLESTKLLVLEGMKTVMQDPMAGPTRGLPTLGFRHRNMVEIQQPRDQIKI